MDVDKKLGMSLDDLIKKTRKEAPKKPRGAAALKKKERSGMNEKKNKLGVRRSLGKKKEGGKETRSTGKTGAVVSRSARKRRARALKNKDMDTSDKLIEKRRNRRKESMSSNTDKKFARKVVVRKGPNAPADARRKVKITNIPYDLTWKDVKGALSDVGTIERCDVTRGEALITFATHKEAARAIQTYNDGDMNGRKIGVFYV